MDFLHGPQKNPAKSFGIAEEVNPIYKLAHKELFLICSLMHVLHLINLGEKSAALENFWISLVQLILQMSEYYHKNRFGSGQVYTYLKDFFLSKFTDPYVLATMTGYQTRMTVRNFILVSGIADQD